MIIINNFLFAPSIYKLVWKEQLQKKRLTKKTIESLPSI